METGKATSEETERIFAGDGRLSVAVHLAGVSEKSPDDCHAGPGHPQKGEWMRLFKGRKDRKYGRTREMISGASLTRDYWPLGHLTTAAAGRPRGKRCGQKGIYLLVV